MVSLYSGTPGSGKSLRAAYKVIDKLLQGMNVIANFPIDMEYFNRYSEKKRAKMGRFVYLPNKYLTPKVLKNFSRIFHERYKERQTLLVIDECGVIFNPRLCMIPGVMEKRMEWLTFFSQHRKLGYDCILISQSDKQIDKQMRFCIETEYKHRAIKNFTILGALASFLCGGLFLCIERWYDNKEKASTEFFKYHKKKAKIYDTFKIFE